MLEFNNDSLEVLNGIWHIIFGIVGIVANAINIINYLQHPKLRTINNRFIISISVTDFIMSTFVTTSTSCFFLFPHLGPWLQENSPHMTEILGFLCYITLWIGFQMIPLISLNRLIYICYSRVFFIELHKYCHYS